MSEIWKAVVGYEGYYEVSDAGNVRSIRNNFGNPRCRDRKLIKSHDGYFVVELSKDNIQKKHKVHHLVLEAFVGPRPSDMEACHDDDCPSNNRLENLRWGTRRENFDDAIRNGKRKGENHRAATITEEVARKIKHAAADKSLLARDIAKEFGTTVSVVRNIRNGKSWGWL